MKPILLKDNIALRFIMLLMLIGVAGILMYSSRGLHIGQGSMIDFMGEGVLIAGFALAAGFFAGFIFAIPKSVSGSETNLIKTGKGYISNDNLVQVSDWLTKIIVGVGLTNLTQMPAYVKKMGIYLSPGLGGAESGQIAAISIVFYFLICGFLFAYLWTRIYFGRMLEDADTYERNLDAPAENKLKDIVAQNVALPAQEKPQDASAGVNTPPVKS